MVDYLEDVFLPTLDEFVDRVKGFVNSGDLGEAEKARLRFESESAGIGQYLEDSNNELSDLVLKLSDVARGGGK
jgi:hypothetical protein